MSCSSKIDYGRCRCIIVVTTKRLVASGLADTAGKQVALQRNREEVVNTQLAILISGLGVTADAETIHVHGQQRPDVLFELRGLRVVIEGKFADHPSAQDVVLDDARKRVRSGIAHIAAAAIYPVALRNTRTTKMLDALRTAQGTREQFQLQRAEGGSLPVPVDSV
jgi:hypothetical protein